MADRGGFPNLVLRRSAAGVAKLLALMVVVIMVELSALVTVRPHRGVLDRTAYWVLALGLAPTLLVIIHFVYRLVSTKPVLTIDSEGVADRTSLFSFGLLRWHEIVDAEPRTFLGQPYIEVITRDAGALIARQRPVKRCALRLNRGMGYGVASIMPNVLPVPADVVVKAIREGCKSCRR